MQTTIPTTPPARGPATTVWQTLRAAIWLEWQARGNWTNPVLYLLFLVLRPVTAALVLVFMYWVISGYSSQGAFFGYLIAGSAAWSFVEQIMTGLPQSVLTDREEYAMLKYVYIAPQRFIVFLVGRTVPRIATALLSCVVTLAFGIVFLGVPIDPLRVNYPLLLGALALGFVAIVGLGLMFAGLALVLKRGAWEMPTAATGALYLISGTIFPLAVLPGWLRAVALATPLTYWLELTRRALLGDGLQAQLTAQGRGFPVAGTPAILGLLALTAAVFVVLGVVLFRYCEFQARERGQLDRTTGS